MAFVRGCGRLPHGPMSPDNPDWQKFRDELVRLAREGDHDWLDQDEVRAVLGDAYRKGLDPGLIISCRAATGSPAEFASRLGQIVRDTPVRILAIDDEASFLALLRLNLEKTGHYVVRTESDPRRWREAVADFHPHLLILDMIMPGVDGRQILGSLRRSPETSRLPVIVLTAILQNVQPDAVHREGILYLSKPVSLKALIHCIEEHLAAVGLR
jgi:CheY-like chemotaxis protein